MSVVLSCYTLESSATRQTALKCRPRGMNSPQEAAGDPGSINSFNFSLGSHHRFDRTSLTTAASPIGGELLLVLLRVRTGPDVNLDADKVIPYPSQNGGPAGGSVEKHTLRNETWVQIPALPPAKGYMSGESHEEYTSLTGHLTGLRKTTKAPRAERTGEAPARQADPVVGPLDCLQGQEENDPGLSGLVCR